MYLKLTSGESQHLFYVDPNGGPFSVSSLRIERFVLQTGADCFT
jgi:hypothetical protein